MSRPRSWRSLSRSRSARAGDKPAVQVAAALVQEALGRRIASGASVFVIEAWIGKRWRTIARSDYETAARRLFNQASYVNLMMRISIVTGVIGAFVVFRPQVDLRVAQKMGTNNPVN